VRHYNVHNGRKFLPLSTETLMWFAGQMERAFSFMDVEALFMAISPAEWFNKRLAPSRHHAVLGSFNTLKPAGKVSLFLLTLFYIIGIGNHFFFFEGTFHLVVVVVARLGPISTSIKCNVNARRVE